MNTRNSSGRAVVLAAMALAATSAFADMTLYEHAKFEGGRVTLRGASSDLSNTGYNDKASSIVVRSGRWEVCTDSNFRGSCTVLTRGEYPTLQSGLNDRISSARELDGSGDRRGDRRDGYVRDEPGRDSYARDGYPRDGSSRDGYPRDDSARSSRSQGHVGVELYADQDFAGQSVRIDRDTADLSRANFNDRTSSLVVRGGTWQVCSDARYGGTCGVYSPGEYSRLGSLNGQVSSVRRVQ